LNTNVKKTKEIKVNVTNTTEKLITDKEEEEKVDSFTYFGSVMINNGGSKENVGVRIRKANGAFIKLYPIWKSKIISKKTKISVFNTNVKSSPLYACETGKVTQQISACAAA
jgi:hypothetical protein